MKLARINWIESLLCVLFPNKFEKRITVFFHNGLGEESNMNRIRDKIKGSLGEDTMVVFSPLELKEKSEIVETFIIK